MSKRNLFLLISVVILFLFGTYTQATVYNIPVTITGPLDASGSSRSAPAKVTTSSPGTCTIGDVIFRSDVTAGQNLFYCTTTNNFTQQLNSGTATGGGITMYSATGLTVTANTYYIPLGGGGSLSTTEANVDIDSPAAATITNMYVQLSVALGGGNSGVFTMRKNAASQSVTCTISGASATNCSDTTHSFAVSQGDLLTIQLVTTGTIVVTPNILIAAQFGNITATGTVNTGTINQVAYYAAGGTAVSGETQIGNGNYYGSLCPGSTAFVATDQTTTSTTFVDLSTADTCTFTLVAVTSVFCRYTANEYFTGAVAAGFDSFFVDGSQADDGNQVQANYFAVSQPVLGGASWLASGLSAASHTIKVEHKVSAQTGHWRDRGLQCWGTPP